VLAFGAAVVTVAAAVVVRSRSARAAARTPGAEPIRTAAAATSLASRAAQAAEAAEMARLIEKFERENPAEQTTSAA
jgi:hypothetical protein